MAAKPAVKTKFSTACKLEEAKKGAWIINENTGNQRTESEFSGNPVKKYIRDAGL